MPPQFEDENASVFSETDLVNAETISVISSSVAADFSEFPKFDMSNLPKDLFTVILNCQRTASLEPWKSLLSASVILSNPVLSLLASSLYIEEAENIMFDSFCCWLLASIDLPTKDSFYRVMESLCPGLINKVLSW